MQTLWQDLTFATRFLRKSPGFTIAAILTLALGIGANATIFGFADALLFRPLPVRDAERIVHVYQRRPGSGDSFPLSYADYLDYRTQTRSFTALAAHYDSSPMHLVIDGNPRAANGAVVTSTYFDLLELQPALGRFFLPEEDRVPDRDAVTVISHALWMRHLGGTAAAVGRVIRVNGRPFTIIGIAPQGFAGVHNGGISIDVWIPTAMFRIGYRFCDGFNRACTIVNLLGKLREGVSIEHAQQEMDLIARRLAVTYPETNKDLGVTVVAARGAGYSPGTLAPQTRQLRLFLLAVGVVLLIGCANVAGLLLARAIRRRKEIALRLALGASRGRLIRQLLTESAVVAALGAGTGLLLSLLGKDIIGVLQATDYAGRPRDFQTDLSGMVVAATAALTLLVTIVVGLVPAIHASRPDVMAILKDEGSSGGARRARLRQVLVVGQITLAIALVVGAGLTMRSVENIFAGPGFDPRPVITLRLRPGLVGYPTEKALAFQREVIERLESLPGVVSASPADGSAATPAPQVVEQRVRIPAERGESERALPARQTRVGPRYFSTLGVPLVLGREFDERDDATAPKVVVINDVLARQISPDGRVVRRALIIGRQPHEIVGVVKDAQYYASDQLPHAVVYRSYWQPNPDGGFNKDSRTLVRVSGDAASMMSTIRRAIAAIDSDVPISEDYPLSSRVSHEFQSVRMARTMLGSFAALALALSAVGLYGVLAFMVGQRTREIGVRIALGASRRDIAALVVRQAAALTLTGAALGLGVAWVSAELMASLLYGVESRDMLAFTAAPAILIAVSLAAIYLPVRRAARVSPLTALRYE
jgi:putative ABC transport system permease protein